MSAAALQMISMSFVWKDEPGLRTKFQVCSGLTSVLHEFVQLLQEVVSLLWVQLFFWLDRQTDRLGSHVSSRSSHAAQQSPNVRLSEAHLFLYPSLLFLHFFILLILAALLLFIILIVTRG